jgi:hypothetical protein
VLDTMSMTLVTETLIQLILFLNALQGFSEWTNRFDAAGERWFFFEVFLMVLRLYRWEEEA